MDEVKTAGNAHVPSSSFAREIEAEPGGADIAKCIQCGMCTASCMVASTTDKYRPRKLIQMILLGLREEVLSSELPWLCMTCRMCEERCQEDVNLAEIFHAVREIAAHSISFQECHRRCPERRLDARGCVFRLHRG